MRTLVTLTTDFGTRDAYVAQLKGVLYAQGPSSLEVIDLTHEIAPQAVLEAALFVRATWPRFPAGTIHLVVVDPGVGSTRSALAVRASGSVGQCWLGPDNGVLSLACQLADGAYELFELQPERFVSGPISATFHGRDVFAPAAAQLAHGQPITALGRALASDMVRLPWAESVCGATSIRGEIVHVDRFGNLISNVTRAQLERLAGASSGRLRVRVAASQWLSLSRCYADVPRHAPLALIGSSDQLEVAVASGSAAQRFGVGLGSVIDVELVMVS